MYVSALLGMLATGQTSSRDVVTACLENLHRVDASTGAVSAFEDERAIADAERMDRRRVGNLPMGVLHGLPVTVKDWIDVEGFPCSGESEDHRDRRPETDATAVARLRAAGAVIVAKTRPFAVGAPGGRVRHPLDLDREPGGSSTGEAVVVATGASPGGLGSDSGGSVRLPAAWCGVVGVKATTGRIPTTGHFPRVGARGDGRTQIGPLTRTVADAERLLAVIVGPDGRDAGAPPVPIVAASTARLSGARFAVLVEEAEWSPSEALGLAVEQAAAALERAGLRRVAWTTPWLRPSLDLTRAYWHRAEMSGADVDRQLRAWDDFRETYLTTVADIDLLLTPTVRETAPLHRELTGEDFIYTLPASLTGSPAISLPAGRDRGGLPTSVQLVGRPWEDHRVLAAARLLEQESDPTIR